MRTFIFALLAGLIMTGGVNADIIDIENIDPATGTYGGTDTFAGFDVTASGDTFAFTGTSDFDGGGAADILTFTLTRSTFGDATITDGSNVAIGSSINGGNATNWFSNQDNLETLGLAISDISYTSGEDDGTTAVFAGFTGVGRQNLSNTDPLANTPLDFLVHTGPVGSTNVTLGSGNGTELDLTSAGTSQQIFITAAAGNSGVRFRDLDLQFETVSSVPEPSSLAVLLGGISMMVMRRRRS